MLTARIILCSAMPRSMAGDGGCRLDMPSYISEPISRQAAGAHRAGVSSAQGLGHYTLSLLDRHYTCTRCLLLCY